MTLKDRDQYLPGYYKSKWPVECGGNRRQKASEGGLWAKEGKAIVNTLINDKWNVMAIKREPSEVYIGGTMPSWSGPEPYGWIKKVDPFTLETHNESPKLPAGGHVWCGAIAAHANGDLYKVNGRYMHRLSKNCEVIIEKKLPVNQAHNGLLILSDGTIITKDLRLSNEIGSTITRLSADTLEIIGDPLILPEGSMGRIASDFDNNNNEYIYVPGIENIWRIKVFKNELLLDDEWSPRYRSLKENNGLAWDGCISNNHLWIMDNGDIDSVRAIFESKPNGRFETPSHRLSWRRKTPWSNPQRLLKVSIEDATIREIYPFGTSGGGIIAPPVHVPEFKTCIAWDSINGGLAGVKDGSQKLETIWKIDIRPTMQPIVFPDTGELVINDFKNNEDFIVVIDIKNGTILDKIKTGSRLANGMFLTAGGNRDIYYCSTFAISYIRWE